MPAMPDVNYVRNSQDYPPSPPSTRTRTTSHPDDRPGFPTRAQFRQIISEYFQSLTRRKQPKALISRDLYKTIVYTLRHPDDHTIKDPQFRFWARRMFALDIEGRVLMHSQRPVAIKEELYDILVQCHDLCRHGGRDRTCREVRQRYSYVPRQIIAAFVRQCSTCAGKRNGQDTNSTDGDPGRTASADRGGDDDAMEVDEAGPSQRSTSIRDNAVQVGDLIMITGPGNSLHESGRRSGALRRVKTDPYAMASSVVPRMHHEGALPPLNRARSATHRLEIGSSASRPRNPAVPALVLPAGQVHAGASDAALTTLPSFGELTKDLQLSPVDSPTYGPRRSRYDDHRYPWSSGVGVLSGEEHPQVSISSGHPMNIPRPLDLSFIRTHRPSREDGQAGCAANRR